MKKYHGKYNKKYYKEHKEEIKIRKQIYHQKNKKEINRRTRLRKNGVRELPKFTQIPYSIPQVIVLGDSRDQANLDNFISPDFSPSDIINRQVVKDLMVTFIKKLSPLDQAILLCRYGFLDGENKKLKYIAKIFKFSSQYIRVKEMLALRRLRFLLGQTNGKNKYQKNILKELVYSLK